MIIIMIFIDALAAMIIIDMITIGVLVLGARFGLIFFRNPGLTGIVMRHC